MKPPDTAQMIVESLFGMGFAQGLFSNLEIDSFAIVPFVQLTIGSFVSPFISIFKLIVELFLGCIMFICLVRTWF
jgi:hypothetical protein